MFKIKKVIKSISQCILMLLFLGYYISITFFTHAHIFNGVTIVHSHFYIDKTVNNYTDNDTANSTTTPIKHTHTSAELTFISLLPVIYQFSIAIICLPSIKHCIRKVKHVVFNNTIIKSNYFITDHSLRAPPINTVTL